MIPRQEHNYENKSSKFIVDNIDYMRQYCLIYLYRLKEMYPLLQNCATKKWGVDYPIKKVAQLGEADMEEKQKIILIGTLFKHQAHKPSILRDLSEENQLAPQPPREHYAENDDQLVLEDEVQRVQLQGNIDTNRMTTGSVCAVLGCVEQSGRFDVESIIFYECGPQPVLKSPSVSRGLLVLMSGLDQSNAQSEAYVEALNVFQHWLSGNISKQKHKQLTRLVVAGNSIQSGAIIRAQSYQSTKSRGEEFSDVVSTTERLDKLFAGWARSIPVDVMPGAYDPSNFMLPQQPFHPLLFPEAAQQRHFQSVTNPYAFAVDDMLIVGTAGQNVSDLLRSTSIEEPLEALYNTLIWSHIAPTAPDTLACYPYKETDPLIMRELPHVYFAGNCSKYDKKIRVGSNKERTIIICVPSFSETKSVVVVDLDSFDCHQVSFASTLIDQ